MQDRRTRTLIIGGLVAAFLLALAVVAPEIYSGTFSDAGTFLRVMLVVVLLAGWAVLAKRMVRPPALAMAVTIVPIAIATWIYVWPYVRPPTEVDEAFPPAAPLSTVAAATSDAPVATGPPPNTSPPATATTTTRPDDSAAASPATAPSASTAPPTTVAPSTVPPSTAPPTTVPTGPVELRRATFQGLTGHRGSGDAAVYRLEDGSILLRFEEVDIGSGPALVVYLVPGEDRRGLGDAIRVADLTAERGNQNYVPPEGVDITSGTWTVLVWCTTFAVEVANATLA